MHINLDQDWRNWAQENLARSCHPAALFDVMRTNGFSAKDIRDVLGDAYPVELDGGYLPSPVDYQALARIPERGGMHPGLSCFSKEPCQLYTIENFLSPDECLELIRRSEGQLTPSKTTYSNGDGAFRTSMTCHLNRHTDPFIAYIDDKISHCLGIRWPYSEPIQMQSYQVGQELKAHHDYFALDSAVYPKVAGKAGQRTWTFVVYLNDVVKGGGTHFFYLDHTFYPKQGMAALWNNISSDGVVNRYTLHAGLPVEEGEKFIITKWFREHGFGPMFF